MIGGLVVVALLLCGAVGWLLLRSKRVGAAAVAPLQPDADFESARDASAASVPPRGEAAAEPANGSPPRSASPKPSQGCGAPLEMPRAAPLPPRPAAVPPSPADVQPLLTLPPAWVAAPLTPRPPAPVIERVLPLEAALAAEWDRAQPLALLPAQAAAVGVAMAGRVDGATGFSAVTLRPGAAIGIARADVALMRALAADAALQAAAGRAGAPARPVTWLDSSAASALVGTALGALASDLFLARLGDETRELKAAAPRVPAGLPAQDGADLKMLVQDLSRFVREARDNYASAVGKLAFRERVGEAAARAAGLWQDGVGRADGVRQQLDLLLRRSPRFGEAQVDTAMLLWTELQEQERLQGSLGRTLAAAHLLRLAIGDPPGGGRLDPLASALAALAAGAAQNRQLATRFIAVEKTVKSDPSVRKDELAARRASLRQRLEQIGQMGSAALAPAARPLERAAHAGLLDAPAGPGHRLLIARDGNQGIGPQRFAVRWLELR